jgi:hypothetical protein
VIGRLSLLLDLERFFDRVEDPCFSLARPLEEEGVTGRDLVGVFLRSKLLNLSVGVIFANGVDVEEEGVTGRDFVGVFLRSKLLNLSVGVIFANGVDVEEEGVTGRDFVGVFLRSKLLNLSVGVIFANGVDDLILSFPSAFLKRSFVGVLGRSLVVGVLGRSLSKTGVLERPKLLD